MTAPTSSGSLTEMGSRAPTISVIVPSYNKPEYLPECLESIRAQTFPDWECIVVDDGSPRGEEIRAAVEAMRDERFGLLRHDVNRGPGAARNTGMRSARADLFLWVDEDDLLRSDCLQVLTGFLSRNADADVVQAQYVDMNSGTVSQKMEIPTMARVLSGSHPNSMGVLLRRDVISRAGEFDESPFVIGREDMEWWIRAMAAGVRLHTLPYGLYFYRRLPDGLLDAKSLNERTKLHEVAVIRYIIEKHKVLYSAHPSARRLLEMRACKKLSIASGAHQQYGRAAIYAWKALLLGGDRQDLYRAVKMTLALLTGERPIDRVLLWRRAMLMKLASGDGTGPRHGAGS